MLATRYVRMDFTSQEEFEQNFQLTIPERFNFAYDIVDEYARLSPDKRAMIWVSERGDARTLTFGDFSRLSDQCANYFQSLGLKKGDAVMLVLKRRYEYWIAVLALLKLGCVFIPATYQLSAKDIVYRVNAASVRAVIAADDDHVCREFEKADPGYDHAVMRLTLGTRDGWLSLTDGIAAHTEPFSKPDDLPGCNDLMLIYFTSGTTGMPKMAAHTMTYPLAHIATAAYWHNVRDDSIHMAVADTGWAKAGWGKIFGQWICGATLFVYDFDRFNAADLLAMISKHHVTNFCAPPTIYRFMIKEDMRSYDLSALKWANVAGEPLPPEVYYRFYEYTGVRLREGFGQTETTPLLMTTRYMTPRPGSTGFPSPQYQIDLVDADGRSVEDGEEGEIVVRLEGGHPPGLIREYYRDEAHTREAFAGGVYHTGDAAWRDVDGSYFFIGRTDDVIKSSGYRIGPFEVESALLTHEAVLECAVTAVPHPERGQVVKATIVLMRGFEPSEALVKDIQDHVKKTTAPYKYPRIVEFVQELPKTESGKIQRGRIRAADRVSH